MRPCLCSSTQYTGNQFCLLTALKIDQLALSGLTVNVVGRSAVIYDKTFGQMIICSDTPLRSAVAWRQHCSHAETTRSRQLLAIFTAIIAGDATTTESLSVGRLRRPTKCRIGQDKCAVILQRRLRQRRRLVEADINSNNETTTSTDERKKRRRAARATTCQVHNISF